MSLDIALIKNVRQPHKTDSAAYLNNLLDNDRVAATFKSGYVILQGE